MIRLDNGLFETDSPGPLLDVAAHPTWLDSLGSREWTVETPWPTPATASGQRADPHDRQAAGTPTRCSCSSGARKPSVGIVGDRGRDAGRLGEYVASRDSLALDPSRMSTQAQLRHALAHELAHRWQARAPGQMAMLWQGTPPIRDPQAIRLRQRVGAPGGGRRLRRSIFSSSRPPPTHVGPVGAARSLRAARAGHQHDGAVPRPPADLRAASSPAPADHRQELAHGSGLLTASLLPCSRS